MPQRLLTTSLPEQGLTADPHPSTLPVSAEKPIFEFDSNTSFLVNRPSLTMSTSSGATTQILTTATAGEGRDRPIPTGATTAPRLRPVYAGRGPTLKTRQIWEGTVTQVRKEGFVAVLSDKTNTSNPDEQASFDFDNTEISPEDLKLVQPGSSFYWIIGNEKTYGGQIRNVSMLQFRRMPTWTKQKLTKAAEDARRFRELLLEEA